MIGSATLFNGLHYIGGEWISDAPNGYSDSINPFNCTCIGVFPNPDNSNYFLTMQGKWIIILKYPPYNIGKDISPMNTHCNSGQFTCQMPGGGRRRIDLDFSGGTITSNAGVSL